MSDTDVYIALNSDGTQVGGYLSDGQQVSIWLANSDIDDGRGPGEPGFEETGWIVLSDGAEKGSTTIADGAGNPDHAATTEPKWTDPTR